MAFVKPLNLLYETLRTGIAVNTVGLVLHLENQGGFPVVDICGVDERPFGVAYMTTADPLFTGLVGTPNFTLGHGVAFLTGVEVAIVREGKVRVPCHSIVADGNIIPGDRLTMDNANTIGMVRRHTSTALPVGAGVTGAQIAAVMNEEDYIVGIALESYTGVAAAGFIEMVLTIKENSITT